MESKTCELQYWIIYALEDDHIIVDVVCAYDTPAHHTDSWITLASYDTRDDALKVAYNMQLYAIMVKELLLGKVYAIEPIIHNMLPDGKLASTRLFTSLEKAYDYLYNIILV
jgi:hypothetical protein